MPGFNDFDGLERLRREFPEIPNRNHLSPRRPGARTSCGFQWCDRLHPEVGERRRVRTSF
jgi:hypothetical protein